MHYQSAIPPWEHQKYALKRLWKAGSALLWADTGTGKTKMAVDYAIIRYLQKQIKKVLVICPVSAIGVWEQEFKTHWPEVIIITKEDTNNLKTLVPLIEQAKIQAFNGKLVVVVVTYHSLIGRLEEITPSGTEKRTGIAKYLRNSYQPNLLIMDESHYLRRYRASWRGKATAIARKAQYVLGLSGTPCPKGYIDLYYQLQAINSNVLPSTIAEFRELYCEMGGYMGKEIIQYKNVKELACRIAPSVIRIPKSVLRLPTTIDSVVPVHLPAKAQNLYNDIARELVVSLPGGKKVIVPHVLAQITRLLQVTGGFLLDKTVHNAKINALRELIEAEQEKVVIFAQYLPEIRQVSKMLIKEGYTFGVITGSVKGLKRSETVRAFQYAKDPKILLVQIQAGSEAISLTASSVEIFYSLSYSSLHYEQARGRIHRAKQKHTCRYIHLIAKGTIDETVYESVHSKMSLQQTLASIVRRLQDEQVSSMGSLSSMPSR